MKSDQLTNDLGVIKRLEAKSSVNSPLAIRPKNVVSDSSNRDAVIVLGQWSGWKPQPRWALQRGQVAMVQENPGNQEKRLSAGQCRATSALLNVTTSNCLSCGFSNSCTVILLPPSSVSFLLDRARRLGTKWMSEPFATSCPQDLHSIRGSVLTPFSALGPHAWPSWSHGWIMRKKIKKWAETRVIKDTTCCCRGFSEEPMLHATHGS